MEQTGGDEKVGQVDDGDNTVETETVVHDILVKKTDAEEPVGDEAVGNDDTKEAVGEGTARDGIVGAEASGDDTVRDVVGRDAVGSSGGQAEG